MALLILAAILYGFARSYFLAGMFRAPLSNLLIHIHETVFSAWIFPLVGQISMVAVGQVGWHRRLGVVGFCLACAMVNVGLLAATCKTGSLSSGRVTRIEKNSQTIAKRKS